jgi:hypothetical protein
MMEFGLVLIFVGVAMTTYGLLLRRDATRGRAGE